MYYYIFDVKKFRKRSQIAAMRDYLGGLGISGEFTYPTAAQTTSELVDLGLSKQYTTIVAVGSDEIANEVASKLLGKQAAMGFIPVEASPELSALIGTPDWKEACQILRYRKINEIRLGRTASGSCFIGKAELEIKSPIDLTLEFKDYIVQAKVKKAVIANFDPKISKIGGDFLDISLESVTPEESAFLKKITSIFGSKSSQGSSTSLFRARSLRIFTKTQIPIKTADYMIAKTPQLIESTEETLRLITAKKVSFGD